MSDFGSSPSRRLMVMAGGTGGHIFPGLAVAEAVRAAGWQVVWLGNPEGMEARLVPARDFEMVGIRFSALRGKGLIRKLLLPFNLLRGFWQAWGALRRIRPDVVLGMGGYVTFPGGMMASLLGKPLLIHEQNAIAGLANKVLARLADRVLTGFPGALPQGICVGNPVREDIAALPPPRERFADRAGPLRILVLGGSLGASALNETIPQGLALLPEHERPQIVHQAGAKHLATLAENYRHSGFDQVDGPQVTITAFIDDMAGAYTWADLVVCRSGALTVSELAAAGVASVLVPFPAAVDDHQRVNARFLSDADAAILVPQNELTPERIVDICRLGRARLLAMAENARALAKAEATKTVARVCMEMAGPTKS